MEFKVNKFKDDIKEKAEELVLKTFPRKTIELHQLLEVGVLTILTVDHFEIVLSLKIRVNYLV